MDFEEKKGEGALVTTHPPPSLWNFLPSFFLPPRSPSFRRKVKKNPPVSVFFLFILVLKCQTVVMSPPSRRLQTKPVITCLKTFLISYSLIFWVSLAWRDKKMGGSKLQGATKGLEARRLATKQTNKKRLHHSSQITTREAEQEKKHSRSNVLNKTPPGVGRVSLVLTQRDTCWRSCSMLNKKKVCHPLSGATDFSETGYRVIRVLHVALSKAEF